MNDSERQRDPNLQRSARRRLGKVDRLLVLAIVVTVAAAVAVAFALSQGHSRGVRIGAQHALVGREALPAALVRMEDDQPVNLIDLRGKTIVITFWGTAWCVPCAVHLNDLAQLWEQYKGRADFEMLAVVCEHPDYAPSKVSKFQRDSIQEYLRKDAREYLAETGLSLPVYVDPGGEARSYFFVDKAGFPTTAVIGRDGRFRAFWPGPYPHLGRELAELLQRLLSESTSRSDST